MFIEVTAECFELKPVTAAEIKVFIFSGSVSLKGNLAPQHRLQLVAQ